MYDDMTTQQLEDLLASYQATITEYEGYGAAWALDSRAMRIAQAGSGHIWAELQRRKLAAKAS